MREIVDSVDLREKIFENHYNYYCSVGVETIKTDSGHLEQVSADYQGRVIYELLQNAFDKAESRILVQVVNNTLYVANNGGKFTYSADHDYKKGTTSEEIFKRCDFQSICSISTSSKDARTSIGNKGVGFKSVFSISDYSNLYTRGRIKYKDEWYDQDVSFRLYDSFRDENLIPEDYSEIIKNNIRDNIANLQRENNLRDRGVPGHYYPMPLNHKNEYVAKLFEQGYVTVIELPFENKEVVHQLVDEIKTIHFNFVRLKYPLYPENFSISFLFDKEFFESEINLGRNNFFSAKIDSSKIRKIADNAKRPFAELEVAMLIKETPNGLLYNYLPTRVSSLFKYVDFHADFHTTVDRKFINWDGSIGQYNKALLRACIELYFLVLNGYLEVDKRIPLQLQFIQKEASISQVKGFKWEWLDFHEDDRYEFYFQAIQHILSIGNFSYENSTTLISNIAKKYFDTHNTSHQDFFRTTINFIQYFSSIQTSNFQPASHKIKDHKTKLAAKLKKVQAKIIPNISLSENIELLYQKKSQQALRIPDFLGVNVTDVLIEDPDFKEALGIRDFTEYNVILRYYKQCSFSGAYSNKALSREDQQQLIGSLFEIFKVKGDVLSLSTHRFSKAYDAKLRERSSTINHAHFNISTVFLEVGKSLYKPAQLCFRTELNENFLQPIASDKQFDDFLRFLGVSFDTEYIFADVRMYQKLKDGIDFLPALVNRNDNDENIDSNLITNFCLIKNDGFIIHPSLINNYGYKFLERLSKRALQLELDNLLVRRYDLFPKEFRDILLSKVVGALSFKDDVIRFYQNTFSLFEKDGNYLVLENNQLSVTKGTDFIILNSKADFEICRSIPNQKILCYYLGQGLSYNLKQKVLAGKKGTVNIRNASGNSKLVDDLRDRFIYLLISISHSKDSDVNYLDEGKELYDLQHKLSNIRIIEGESLRQEIQFGEHIVHSSGIYAVDLTSETLYLSKDATNNHKALAVGEYFFSNHSIKDIIELVLFSRDVLELKFNYDPFELDVIVRKWKKDYSLKYASFQRRILSHFGIENCDDRRWYIYNDVHKSDVLVKLDGEGKLSELQQIIEISKTEQEFEGYFDSFQLEIDLNSLTQRLARLLTYLDLNEQHLPLDFCQRLRQFKIKLGGEEAVAELEQTIKKLQPQYDNTSVLAGEEKKHQALMLETKIDQILHNFNTAPAKNIVNINLHGQVYLNTVSSTYKKVIFQGNGSSTSSSDFLEFIGASGEERVLFYFIKEFLKLETHERIIGINEVYQTIRELVNDDSLLIYKDDCLKYINDNKELKRALIPFFYITLHHKYSYFDLIVYKDQKPTLIEVKTTESVNNNRFFLSSSEVDGARGELNYEIIRDCPGNMYFLGNPIKLIEDQLTTIVGSGFSMIPKNYEFIFRPDYV